MFNRHFLFLTCLAAGLASSASAQVTLPEGKGKTILDNECQECHSLDSITSQSLSAAEWRSMVNRMVRRGAAVKAPDVDTLVEYLVTYFGPEKVDINSAGSTDLQKAFGLTVADADSLILYRKANGPFKEWNDLVKADAGVAKKMESKRELISFAPPEKPAK